MSFFAIILILIIGASDFDLFVGISDLTNSLHSYCLKFTPESFYSEIYEGLVCGKAISSTEISQNLKNLGVYHAIIVSGSHLIFLSVLIEKIFYWERLRAFRHLIFPILVLYALATGAEPPVIRALVSIGVERIQRQQKLFWNQNEVIFISLLICLCLSQTWQNSFSLLLSYVASLSMSLSTSRNFFVKSLIIYLILFPFLLPLSAPGPLSFITNMILSPVIGFVLFPLSFFSFVIPYLSRITDQLWKAFFYICSLLGPELSTLNPVAIPIYWLWIFAVLLNFYGIYREKRGLHEALA